MGGFGFGFGLGGWGVVVGVVVVVESGVRGVVEGGAWGGEGKKRQSFHASDDERSQ